ncbi:uncharacterized protein BO95DRAFT_442694 [Aspergillus brunneoviolaceus CBS 621.78]|uniref:Uncharacterized protein n=1 Tax=Aspergillus brunneoviolaceus CBS 621.78 TaxID=1450534 RepID=A0ACD1G9C5_9EURO|nr:hypothetical protein BO95DRAFT_442694 [Aspergillus brunneoviolaceus CBS 621.78]RAH45805.1 hypothetical protein BO95DRAFT_442694 [Aspergillus brunneoviolaceus CBS 621.78]
MVLGRTLDFPPAKAVLFLACLFDSVTLSKCADAIPRAVSLVEKKDHDHLPSASGNEKIAPLQGSNNETYYAIVIVSVRIPVKRQLGTCLESIESARAPRAYDAVRALGAIREDQVGTDGAFRINRWV